MRREEEYRRQLHMVNSEVKKRLDYHVCCSIIHQLVCHIIVSTHTHTLKVEVETAIRKHEQEQLIKWLTAQVIEAVKSKKVNLLWCIEVDTAVV